LIFGTITCQKSGTGNAALEGVSGANKGVLDITHNGSGKFYVRAYDDKGNEKILVDTQGGYSGKLTVPGFYPFSLDITADGEWTVTARFSSRGGEENLFSGSGDYVTGMFNVSANSCEWKIEYVGEGPFVVRLHVSDETETLVDSAGPYSDTVTSDLLGTTGDNVVLTGYFEILSSGDWTIERISK